jgi:hypothetical protein
MMSPLLACVRRKLHDMCRVLISAGADKKVTDRIVSLCNPLICMSYKDLVCIRIIFLLQNRSGLYFAVRSGDVGMVRRFLKQEGCNQADFLWVSCLLD